MYWEDSFPTEVMVMNNRNIFQLPFICCYRSMRGCEGRKSLKSLFGRLRFIRLMVRRLPYLR